MELTEKQDKLLEFVKRKHKDQVRRYTGEPYFNHPLSVAELVNKYVPDCIEIALCHDLFEDTDCDFSALHKEMVSIGYNHRVAYEVCSHVNELTDVFTKEDYHLLNREKRKSLEAKRLGTISCKSQSVKYADLIDNTLSIVEHDIKFAKVYLREKEDILNLMDMGDVDLLLECRIILQESISRLN